MGVGLYYSKVLEVHVLRLHDIDGGEVLISVDDIMGIFETDSLPDAGDEDSRVATAVATKHIGTVFSYTTIDAIKQALGFVPVVV